MPKCLLGDVVGIDLKNKTVTSKLLDWERVTPFDSLIVAAGAQQSYFGNDQFEAFAPGMKTVDDALELRGRILGAFEAAEVTTSEAERKRRLTFVVVGAGPTGVEVVGQIAELADRTLKGAFRTIDPTQARVILVEAAPAVLPPMGPKLGLKAQRRLEKMGVEVKLNTMVTDVDYMGLTVKEGGADGEEARIEAAVKVWSAGVQASPLGKQIADQSDGTEVDRAGRVVVEPDLTVKGHPNVFVIGDLMSVPGVPGMAQGAIQGAVYATKQIKNELNASRARGAKAVQVLEQRQHGHRLPVQRGGAGRQGRVRRVPRVARVAGASPLLPRGQPQPHRRRVLLVHHLPGPRSQPAGDHRKVGVRPPGTGAIPRSERREIRWVTRAKIDPS